MACRKMIENDTSRESHDTVRQVCLSFKGRFDDLDKGDAWVHHHFHGLGEHLRMTDLQPKAMPMKKLKQI